MREIAAATETFETTTLETRVIEFDETASFAEFTYIFLSLRDHDVTTNFPVDATGALVLQQFSPSNTGYEFYGRRRRRLRDTQHI